MAMLGRTAITGFASVLLLFAMGCGGDDGDSGTEQEESPVGGNDDDAGDDDGAADDGTEDDGDAADGDATDGDESDGDDGASAELRASCEDFCAAQAECLGLTLESCQADCGTQVQMLEARECAAEGTAENRCISELSCEELMKYAADGRRAHAQCGAAATDYFAACTDGEAAECTAMCARQESCGSLPASVGACEEMCLLREMNSDLSGGEDCGERFLEFATCLSEASCEELETGATPESCAAVEQALNEACSS
jgi:hypothetical protein